MEGRLFRPSVHVTFKEEVHVEARGEAYVSLFFSHFDLVKGKKVKLVHIYNWSLLDLRLYGL